MNMNGFECSIASLTFEVLTILVALLLSTDYRSSNKNILHN